MSSLARISWIGLVAALCAVAVAPAQAHVLHTVAAGESLSSIAAVDGLSVDELAAANGLSPDAELLESSTVVIPGSDAGAGSSSAGASSDGAGGYVVAPGDTLTGVAASFGLWTEDLAAANGLGVDDPLYAGTTLTIPGGSTATTADEPYPTPGTVTGDEIANEAATQNVGPNFAKAVGWQESGWENGLVSSANARGVMQITPDTWDFIQDNLAGGSLDPSSPLDNVRAGVMYLGHLFDRTGDDPVNTLASYYQGPGAVESDGLYPETEQYVDSVLSLRDWFAGG